jgi:hypothetical protein
MRADAFDNVKCPFNYKKELMRARRALDAKVAKYISKNRAKRYRDLAQEFHLSLGTLSKIARRHLHKRKPGPRSRENEQPSPPQGETAPVVSFESTDTE